MHFCIAFDWIVSRLQKCKQCLVINEFFQLKVTSGVTHGSDLGPTFFLVYINNLKPDLLNKLCKLANNNMLLSCVLTNDKRMTVTNDN